MPPYAKREIKNDGERKTTWQDKGHENGDSQAVQRRSPFSLGFLISLFAFCFLSRVLVCPSVARALVYIQAHAKMPFEFF